MQARGQVVRGESAAAAAARAVTAPRPRAARPRYGRLHVGRAADSLQAAPRGGGGAVRAKTHSSRPRGPSGGCTLPPLSPASRRACRRRREGGARNQRAGGESVSELRQISEAIDAAKAGERQGHPSTPLAAPSRHSCGGRGAASPSGLTHSRHYGVDTTRIAPNSRHVTCSALSTRCRRVQVLVQPCCSMVGVGAAFYAHLPHR